MGIGLTVLTNLAQWTLVAAPLPGSVPDTPLSHDQLPSAATAELADASAAGQAALSPAPRLVDINLALVPSAAELVRSADGLFYLDAKVNGVPVRFLVDTGATSVVLTDADARRAGVATDLSGSIERAETAGGSTPMARVRLASLEAGPARRHDVEACVTASGLSVSLLGQSWLAQFESVTITRDRMVLR
jgi:clan AA aspartic protease (TIGR02281 family)